MFQSWEIFLALHDRHALAIGLVAFSYPDSTVNRLPTHLGSCSEADFLLVILLTCRWFDLRELSCIFSFRLQAIGCIEGKLSPGGNADQFRKVWCLSITVTLVLIVEPS